MRFISILIKTKNYRKKCVRYVKQILPNASVYLRVLRSIVQQQKLTVIYEIAIILREVAINSNNQSINTFMINLLVVVNIPNVLRTLLNI